MWVLLLPTAQLISWCDTVPHGSQIQEIPFQEQSVISKACTSRWYESDKLPRMMDECCVALSDCIDAPRVSAHREENKKLDL